MRHSVSLTGWYYAGMSMRTWNDTLYLDAMPGRKKLGRLQGDFSAWLREMQENRITTEVCLAPEEQITAESPEYAEWRRQQQETRDATAPINDATRYELIDIPVDDFRAPDPFVAGRFWNAAADTARRIATGDRVFIHCGAGIGRTGMFAVAVLMASGYGYDEALDEIKGVGSYPETALQQEFLERGTNTPTIELQGRDDAMKINDHSGRQMWRATTTVPTPTSWYRVGTVEYR